MAIVACAPVLTTRYGYVDDYTLLYDNETGRDVSSLGFAQGRPVATLLQMPLLLLIDGVSGLVVMRLISVLCFATMAVVLGRAMLARGFTTTSAWTCAIGLFMLPSTAIMVAWSILYFGAVAALLAASAAVVLVDGHIERTSGSFVSGLAHRRTLLAGMLLCLAVLAYQPSAMVFWPCVFLMLASPRRPAAAHALVQPVGIATCVGGAALVAGYIAVRVGGLFSQQASERTALVSDPVNKVGFLLSEVIPYALFPWLLDVRLGVAVVVTLVLTALLLTTLPGGLVDRIAMTGLAGAAVVLGWLANLPIAENAPYSRTAVGVMVAFVAILAVVVDGVSRRVRHMPVGRGLGVGWVALLTAFSVLWMSHVLTTYITKPAAEELDRVETAVRELPPGDTVTVVAAAPGSTLAPRTASEEFGRATGVVYWALKAFTELAYRDEIGTWPEPGRFSFPSDEDYEQGRLRDLPARGWVLDYQRILNPQAPPAVFETSR